MVTSGTQPVQSIADEKLVFVRRHHWMRYASSVTICLLLLIIGLLLLSFSSFRTPDLAAVAYIVFFLGFAVVLCSYHALFHTLMSAYATVIILTTKRVVHFRQKLFFIDDRQEIQLERMHTVEARQRGILQSLFHCGSIWFDAMEHLSHIAHPHRTAKEIARVLGMK